MNKIKLSRKEKKTLIRIIISLILFINLLLIDKIFKLDSILNIEYGFILPLVLYFIVYLVIGYDVLKKAFFNIIHLNPLDENFLMSIASLGAFGLGIYKGLSKQEIEGFDEACAVLIFYQIGELFQRIAISTSRKSIASLMDIRPDYANLEKNGIIEEVDPSIVQIGDIIVIKPGEKVPLDGEVIEGETLLDTSSLTGESLPKEVSVNDKVLSGTLNLNGLIKVRVEKMFYDSTVSKILDLVENASFNKSKAENFISKFARVYTPIVVTCAILLVLIPTIFLGDFSTWLYRGLNFLVVSCPCALVISVPLTFFSGIGACSKNQILVKGSSYLEKFNEVNTIVFDKTGTITKGNFVVSKIYSINNDIDEVLYYCSVSEAHSNHPIAKSLIKRYGKELDLSYSILDIPGKGIKASKNEEEILCGNEKLMKEYNIEFEKATDPGTIVYLSKNDKYLGYVVIEDEIKENAKEVIQELKKMNIKTVMLTGDNYKIAEKVSDIVGIDEYKSSLLPKDKVDELQLLLKNKKKKDVVSFVGDGINDAPVLMLSDVGIAMGQVGSDAALEASDIVLMKDDLSSLLKAKKISKKTMQIVYQNIYFSLIIKIGILILSAFGLSNMWFAVFGDVGVAIIAILNALRAFKIKD